jgi:hypothetical protein
MVLRYSVAIIGWLPVMNDSTRYRQLLLLLRNSKKNENREFLVEVFDITAAKEHYRTVPRSNVT